MEKLKVLIRHFAKSDILVLTYRSSLNRAFLHRHDQLFFLNCDLPSYVMSFQLKLADVPTLPKARCAPMPLINPWTEEGPGRKCQDEVSFTTEQKRTWKGPHRQLLSSQRRVA